jgi:glycosyltransferase involved in cell wall biosynthesis/GT2 family glycosyltransferase
MPENNFPTVAIGIAAFNEQANIQSLLASILAQAQANYKLTEIIVANDGSTDNTVNEIKKIQSPLIRLINDDKRLGKAERLNQIYAAASADILIQLDADISFAHNNVLGEIVKVASGSKADLTCGNHLPLSPRNYVERLAGFGIDVWFTAVSKVTEDQERYRETGHIMALNKNLYTNLKYPSGAYVNDDMYCYYFSKLNGYKIVYAEAAKVFYKLPSTIRDYLVQMRRMLKHRQVMAAYFGDQALDQLETMTTGQKYGALLEKVLQYPPHVSLGYMLLQLSAKISAYVHKPSIHWSIAESSKIVNAKTKLIFSNYDDISNPYYAGGGSFAVHYIAKRLAGKYDVTVITNRYPGSKDAVIDNVTYKRIGLSISPRVDQFVFHFLLWFYVLRMNFDVWIESYTPPFSTACLQLFTSKPVIGVTHLLGGEAMSKKYKLPFSWFEKKGLKTYKHVIALTEYLADKIKNVSPGTDVTVIPNGLDKEIITLSFDKPESKFALFLGRIDVNHKGLDYLLNSYKLIAGRTDVDLIIAGAGIVDDVDWLLRRIQDLGLTDRVKYVGKVSGEKKADLYRKSLFVVMPSRYEGQGIVALEAFAYRSALLIFDIRDFEWIPKDCAVKVEPFNVQKYADAMLNLVNDKEYRTLIEQNAKNFVQDFDWDEIALNYDKLIQKALAYV